MRHEKKISRYLQESADRFSLELDEDDLFFENLPMSIPNSKPLDLNDPIDNLYAFSVVFGITEEDILACNQSVIESYYKKYPYFYLMKKLDVAKELAKATPEQADNILHNSIFNGQINHPHPALSRYSISEEELKERLLQYLKERAKYFPEVYHKDETVTNLSACTAIVADFPDLPLLLKEFVRMVKKAKHLFFKILKKQAAQEERRDYNFLVSALRLRDIYSRNPMYADWIDTIAEIIESEGSNDFFSYVKLDTFSNFCPWCCKQFADDPSLAQKYIKIFPTSKQNMLNYYRDCTNFFVTYNWSGDPPHPYAGLSDEELEELMEEEFEQGILFDTPSAIDELWENCMQTGKIPSQNEIDMCLEKDTPAYALKSAYIPKTQEEIGNDAEYFSKLAKLCRAPNQGGLVVPRPAVDMGSREFIDRMIARHKLSHRNAGDDYGV